LFSYHPTPSSSFHFHSIIIIIIIITMSSSNASNAALAKVLETILSKIEIAQAVPMGGTNALAEVQGIHLATEIARLVVSHWIEYNVDRADYVKTTAFRNHGPSATVISPVLLSTAAEIMESMNADRRISRVPAWDRIGAMDQRINRHPLFHKTLGYESPTPLPVPVPVPAPVPAPAPVPIPAPVPSAPPPPTNRHSVPPIAAIITPTKTGSGGAKRRYDLLVPGTRQQAGPAKRQKDAEARGRARARKAPTSKEFIDTDDDADAEPKKGERRLKVSRSRQVVIDTDDDVVMMDDADAEPEKGRGEDGERRLMVSSDDEPNDAEIDELGSIVVKRVSLSVFI
jgi:hypothetical protein